MNKIIISSILFVLLGACSLTKSDLGLEKESPDEMMVVSRRPLSIPPEFGLRPLIADENISETPEFSKGEQALLEKIK